MPIVCSCYSSRGQLLCLYSRQLPSSIVIIDSDLKPLGAFCRGLGSSFNMVLWAAAILKQQRPDITLYYDHTKSPYQCSSAKTLEAVLRPGNRLLKTSEPPSDCVPQRFVRHAVATEELLMKSLGGLITETVHVDQPPITSFQQSVERRLLLDAMFQAICPIVMDFWHLAPELEARANVVKRQLQSKQRPVIAIHARGGDKKKELRKYVDPDTHQYPMLEGMQRLAATHPGIRLSGPVCLIFGDDNNYAQQVREMAETELNCSEIILRVPKADKHGYDKQEFKQLTQNLRCQATGDYLVDIELMGWSTLLVANHRANADTTATFLRKCKYFYDYSSTIPGTGAPHFTLWAR